MKHSSSSHITERLQLLMTERAPAWAERELQQGWRAPTLDRSGQFVGACLLTLSGVAILFARRPDQFLHPYIWVEEGLYTLRFYAESGWSTLFEPLAGYLLRRASSSM